MAASFYTKYKVLCKIGEGSFSEVLKCQDRATGQQYAAKRLRSNYRTAAEAAEIPEAVAARKLSPHANVLHLLEHHFDSSCGSVILIFELMDMSLYDLLKARTRSLPEARVRSLLYQLLRGCEHLHRNGIFHRDVKPENILVKGDCVKLGDLGSIRGSYSKPPYTEYISTRWYRSPECLLTAGFYGPKMDIWATGCVFYEMFTLKPLFPGTNEVDQLAKIHGILGTPHPRLFAKLKRHQSRTAVQSSCAFPSVQGCGLGPLLPSLSEGGRDLLRLTLIYDPDQRAHARRLLRHSYFVDLRECSSAASSTSSVCPRRSWQGQVGSGGDRAGDNRAKASVASVPTVPSRISIHRGCSTVDPAPSSLRVGLRPAPAPRPGPRPGPRPDKQRSCSTSFLPRLPPARRATLHTIPEATSRKELRRPHRPHRPHRPPVPERRPHPPVLVGDVRGGGWRVPRQAPGPPQRPQQAAPAAAAAPGGAAPAPSGPPRLAALAPPQQLLQPRLSTASAHHLYRAPSHRRLSSYTDFNGRIVGFGSIELAEGKAAWQERERERERGERGERERRASACEAGINHRLKSTEARRRWMRRNRIHDTAFGGSSSDEDDIPFPFGHESAAANALLYVGLGTVAIGMVIAFVGTGEKGFKTLELRLIGPTLIVGGLLCILLRVMLCVCPSKCLLRRFRQRSRHKKQQMALEAAGRIAMGPCRALHNRGIRGSSRPPSRSSRPTSRTSRPPSRGSRAPSELARSPSDPADPSVSGGARGKKRVSIASGNAGVHRPGTGTAGLAGQSQVLAATSLFLQNEQQANSSCSSKSRFNVPSINLPSLVRGRSEDLGDSGNGSRRLSQASKRLGSTGDLPLLAAMDADPEGSFNSAFSPDDATAAGPSNAAQSTPHAIIVTSPTPSSSPRPAPRPTPRSAPRPAREIILSPGGLQ